MERGSRQWSTTADAEVEALVERIRSEQGRIDLLVNNAWDGYGLDDGTFDEPFWVQPMERFDRMWSGGLRATMLTTRAALPLLLAADRGLVVNTTLIIDVGAEYGALVGAVPPVELTRPGERRSSGAYYETVKVATNLMTLRMAKDLAWAGRPVGVVGVSPGFLRTEAALAGAGTDEQRWHLDPGLHGSESTELIGRGVAALAGDGDVLAKSGQTFLTRQLATTYGFSDLGGWRPGWNVEGPFGAAMPAWDLS